MNNDKVIPVKVALRIRPLVPRESAEGCAECLRTLGDLPQVILGKDKSFTYDYVFSKTTPQIEVYETSVQPLLNALFKGYNTTVLAYGQTGSGKTYSMGSACLQNVDFDNVGVIPRVLNDLFYRIDETKDVKFTVKVSFVEVYNEEIKDLLNPRLSEPLNIREENNSIKVVNLTETVVSTVEATRELLEKGTAGRVVGGTAMNDQSSRSHAIFTITLEQLVETDNHLVKSKFHLVDLAGSERQSKTKAEGLRLKEGININLGLLALGNVISVLGEDNPSNKAKHVPYRESKLTRLLQDSLGGNSHTLMIACVSPADSNMEESLNTLRYADRARKIKNKPIVNIDPQAAELANLRQQVQDLKAQLFKITGGALPNVCIENASELTVFKEECEKLKHENLKLAGELQRLIHINRITYEKMTKSELDREELQKKFDEIKTLFTSITKSCQLGENNTDSAEFKDLKSKLTEYEEANAQKQEQTQELNNDIINDENAVVDKDYALRQAKMQIQLNEYDTELYKKQMLHQKMIESTLQYNGVKYESCIDDLKHKVDMLEREKEELQDLIKQGSESKKISDQRRDRLRSLEAEVLELKRKEKECQRLVKVKEENEKHCEKLRQEIVHIKQERVKLIKQMKADTESFRKYKQEKEKEVNQLKAAERKHLVEISKLQEGNNRQEAVLRRKNEEITRIQKQLRETFEKQKQVAEKRQMAFDRKDSSSMGEKLRQWITQEIELSVGLAEGRLTLSKLIDERKEFACELSKLQDKYKELQNLNEDEPPSKIKRETVNLDATYIATNTVNEASSNEGNEELKELKLKIESLKADIECKNAQINDIQQMVIEGDQDEKTKHMFNSLHGMLEAKVLMKHLYSCSVQYLLESKTKQIQFENSSNGLNNELKEIKRKFDLLEEELERSKRSHTGEITSLTQYYEQRILCLLKMNVNESTYTSDEKFRILAEQIDLLERKSEKNEFRKINLQDITNAEDAKRNRKMIREMRKTRVIRSNKLDDSSSNKFQIISEDSPLASPQVDHDDKRNDPDWLNTPLRVKQKKISAKKLNRNSRSSKSRSTLLKPSDSDSIQNDENCMQLD